MQGWVKLHREIRQAPFFNNKSILHLYIWLLTGAAHEAHQTLVGNTPVPLKEGQLIFGSERVAAELNVPRTTLYRHLKALERLGVIVVEAKRNFSIITLTDWQVSQHGAAHTGNTADTPTEPYNNDKNEKNEKKYSEAAEKISFAEFVFLTEAQYAQLVATYGEEDTRAMIELLNNHKGATGKVYKEDYFAILSWCAERVKSKKEAPAANFGKRNRFLNYTDENNDYSEVEAQAIRKLRQRSEAAKTSSA